MLPYFSMQLPDSSIYQPAVINRWSMSKISTEGVVHKVGGLTLNYTLSKIVVCLQMIKIYNL